MHNNYSAFKQIPDFPSILHESYLGEVQNALVQEKTQKMARASLIKHHLGEFTISQHTAFDCI